MAALVKLSFYEQVGIVIPGAVFVAVLLAIIPETAFLISPKDVSLGGFGIFLLMAYAGGHAIAAAGNAGEAVWWSIRGGMPSDWVVYDDARILSNAQKQALIAKVHSVFGMQLPGGVVGLSRASWSPVFRQIYRVALAQNPGRIEAFNGNYGLNRGLAAALFVLAAVAQLIRPGEWHVSAALLAGALVYGFRMNRFGVNFAREVYLSFLNAKAS